MGVRRVCTKCDLALNVTNQIHGQGSNRPSILFIYDHPTKTQDQNKDLFSGRYFTKLKNLLKAHGIFDCSYHTHLMKCRPPFVEAWEYQKIELKTHKCSSSYFAEEFQRIRNDVKIIVPVGRFAYQLITSSNYIPYNKYLEVVNNPFNMDVFKVYPINSINTLIKEQQLNHVILNLKTYYAHNFNPSLLIKDLIK